MLAPVAVKEVSGVEPPTDPKATAPEAPPLRINELEPSTVFEKVILAPAAVNPPLVVSTVVFAVMVTGLLKVASPPLVVIFPARLIAVGAV